MSDHAIVLSLTVAALGFFVGLCAIAFGPDLRRLLRGGLGRKPRRGGYVADRWKGSR